MKTQNSLERINNFDEVELGFTKEEAKEEANRCLQCANPRCVKGCPVNVMIPQFIKEIKEGNIEKAYEVIRKSSSLPSICGRVCPQEKQCESMCIKGIKDEPIAIGALERYVADIALKNNMNSVHQIEKNGKKVAIVGSGPASLSCAGELIKNGYDVTIYEVLHKLGGVLTYGIPEFRLPKKIVEDEINSLKELGVKMITDVLVGSTLTIDDLKKEYDYVFLGTGAGIPKFMGIEGEDGNTVFSANEVLTRINLMKSYKKDSKTPIKKAKKAYVIGGGNVAMDTVRSLKRLGIESHLMYRRGEEELPARKVEIEHAKEEGIIFDFLKNPKRILLDDNNNVIGMEVIDMVLGEEVDGRRSVKESTNITKVDCDMVVMALGTSTNHEALKNSDIKLTDKDLIYVEDSMTSVNNVYAGGDAVTGSATVILAMEAGIKAAKKIMES